MKNVKHFKWIKNVKNQKCNQSIDKIIENILHNFNIFSAYIYMVNTKQKQKQQKQSYKKYHKKTKKHRKGKGGKDIPSYDNYLMKNDYSKNDSSSINLLNTKLKINDVDNNKLNKLINNYYVKNNINLEDLNEYARFFILGQAPLIKDNKVIVFEKSLKVLQEEGNISYEKSVELFAKTILEMNQYSNNGLKQDENDEAIINKFFEATGKDQIQNNKELFKDYSTLIRIAWQISGEDDVQSLLGMSKKGGTDNTMTPFIPPQQRGRRLLLFIYLVMLLFSIYAIFEQISNLTQTISELYDEYGETDTEGQGFSIALFLQICQQMFIGSLETTINIFEQGAINRAGQISTNLLGEAQYAAQGTWDRGLTNGVIGLFTGLTQSEVIETVQESAEFQRRRALEDAQRVISLRFRDIRRDVQSRWTTLIVAAHMLPTSTILLLNYVNPIYVNNITATGSLATLANSFRDQGISSFLSLISNMSIAGAAVYRSIRGIRDPITFQQEPIPSGSYEPSSNNEVTMIENGVEEVNQEIRENMTNNNALVRKRKPKRGGRKINKKTKSKINKRRKKTVKKSTKHNKRKNAGGNIIVS